MALTFRCFKNKVTGQVCYVEAGRFGNFKSAIKKLTNYVRYNIPRYYVAHVTLTLADNESEIHYEHLHRVISFIKQRLRRADSDLKYVAVKEFRGAVHYHVLCVYSKPYVFPKSEDIANSWKLGFVKISAPKLRLKVDKIVGYIGKYIDKGYEYEALNTQKSFTASQIKQIYKLAPSRLAQVIIRFGKELAETYKCTYRKIYEILEIAPLKGKFLVMEFPSEWEYQGIYGEPF